MSINKINAFIVNRNLISTLKNTIDFLKKEDRINIWILDQNSDYIPLLEYYNTNPTNIHYFRTNEGPYSVWNTELNYIKNNQYYILADSDCLYDDVPNDWLDKMIEVLEKTNHVKVGFSLDISDTPNTHIGIQAKEFENKYWINKDKYGWIAPIDTTFALYRPNSGFSYDALRLDKPYCIKHQPWYITKENITEEWTYYLNNINHMSTWGHKIKTIL